MSVLLWFIAAENIKASFGDSQKQMWVTPGSKH